MVHSRFYYSGFVWIQRCNEYIESLSQSPLRITNKSIFFVASGQPEEDLADEEEGESERANLPDVQVDATGIAFKI